MLRAFTLGALLAVSLVAPAYAQVRGVPGLLPKAADPDGITVSGSATERLPATTAVVHIQLGTRNNAATLDAPALAPLIDALVQAGADRSSIVLPLQFQAPGKFNTAQVTATVANPTVDALQRGVVSVGTVIANMPGVLLGGAQVELRRSDCAESESRARQTAIDRARAKALATAHQLGVHLGRVSAVRVNDQQTADGSCSSSYMLGPYMQQLQNAADYVTINVFSSVTITYAIR